MTPRDYTVRLEQVFQGPMDLLLHLVREQEVEIHEIDIAPIIEGYLAYLETLDELDLEYAADFLVMAATLMSIKSRSLLPREEIDLEEELDPKDELIQRLIEYRRFKEAGEDLGRRWDERQLMFPRGDHPEMPEEPERTFELGELTTWDLLAVFSRLMRETLADRPHMVEADPHPLRYYVEAVVKSLRLKGDLSLRALIQGLEHLPPKDAIVGSFCALLELVRMQLVDVRQERLSDEITLHLREEHAEEAEEIVARSLPAEGEHLGVIDMDDGADAPEAGGGSPNGRSALEEAVADQNPDGPG